MTNKEYAISQLEKTSIELNNVISMLKEDKIPQNEDWVKVATPLHNVMNILLNYEKYKDEELGKTKLLLRYE